MTPRKGGNTARAPQRPPSRHNGHKRGRTTLGPKGSPQQPRRAPRDNPKKPRGPQRAREHCGATRSPRSTRPKTPSTLQTRPRLNVLPSVGHLRRPRLRRAATQRSPFGERLIAPATQTPGRPTAVPGPLGLVTSKRIQHPFPGAPKPRQQRAPNPGRDTSPSCHQQPSPLRRHPSPPWSGPSRGWWFQPSVQPHRGTPVGRGGL